MSEELEWKTKKEGVDTYSSLVHYKILRAIAKVEIKLNLQSPVHEARV